MERQAPDPKVHGDYTLLDGGDYERKAAMLKDMKGWKTIAFNSVVALVGVLAATNWVDVVPDTYVGPIVAAIGFINMWLRTKTDTPMGAK
jgi:hypothetical protein